MISSKFNTLPISTALKAQLDTAEARKVHGSVSEMQLRAGYLAASTIALLAMISTSSAQVSEVRDEESRSDRDGLSSMQPARDERVRPVFDGVTTGGTAAGIAIGLPAPARWQTTATVRLDLRRHWSVQVASSHHAERSAFAAYARMRDMPRLDYYGPGETSDIGDRTSFRLQDPLVGLLASVRVLPSVLVAGRVETMWPTVGRGRAPRLPSIEERFSDVEAPGLLAASHMLRYQVFTDLKIPGGPGEALHQGAHYRVTYATTDDLERDRFAFGRLDVEGRQRFAILVPNHRLTLHAWLATTFTDPQSDVPFFLQPSLGGREQLTSVHEEPIGSDDTVATLRGFRGFRFRDRHVLLLQAEYRLPVWGPFDATIFVDAGKVANRSRSLNLADLKRDYGFSVSMMRGSNAAARVDVGFGGGEGNHVMISVGDFLP